MEPIDNHHTEEDELHPGNLMESKTSHLDDLLSRKLEDAFHKETSNVLLNEVAKIASEHDPIDLAYAVSRLPLSVRPVIYENLPGLSAKVEFLVNTDKNTRMEIFRILSDEEIVQVITSMPTDEVVWVLEDMSDRRFRRVLEKLETSKAQRIRELQQHGRNSAGRLMTNEFFAFPMDMTIEEVSQYIRDNPGIELTRLIFVLNQVGELQGCVPARNLIVNPSSFPLRQVMQPVLHKVSPDALRDEVVDIVERYKVPALPVVDEDNYLLGVVTYEDVVELIEDIADETIARMAGTGEHLVSYEPIGKRILARVPWLIVTICGGFIAATAMGYFSGLLGTFLAFVVFFVPIITGMSGNVGIQCSTVLVRSMATGVLTVGGRSKAIWRELCSGLVIGVIFGTLGALVVWMLHTFGLHTFGDNVMLAATILGVGLLGACMCATVLGVFAPLFFAHLGVDPAVAAGPIITAFNDVFSMIMYFLIARAIVHLF